jgi:predicted metal-dependent TIM-barrel fold hydrolase
MTPEENKLLNERLALAQELDHLIKVFMPDSQWNGVDIHDHAIEILIKNYGQVNRY